jgi:hypothetical protein
MTSIQSKNVHQQKIPRGIILANNWKKQELEYVLILRDEMLLNKINNNLIKQFLDEEYNRITEEYENKINKYNKKHLPSKQNKIIKSKRKKAINFLLQTKTFLENNGASIEYINKYINKQYTEINNTYVLNDQTNNLEEIIDFIDE